MLLLACPVSEINPQAEGTGEIRMKWGYVVVTGNL
jgi:hypothetical protein